MSYDVGDLRQHAWLAIPENQPTPPVLVANHGYHPDPPRYGFDAQGRNRRPGDYYRSAIQAYVDAGFATLVADYRGHNASEGFEFTQSAFASNYYAQDVLSLMSLLSELEHSLDLDNVFMWGHSMGGEVSLIALLATPANAASLWSTMGGTRQQQAAFYGRNGGGSTDDTTSERFARTDVDAQALEPTLHLSALRTPLLLQHAVADQATAFEWSVQIASQLRALGHPVQLVSYEGSSHLFEGEQFAQAVARDVTFFRQHLRQAAPEPPQACSIKLRKSL